MENDALKASHVQGQWQAQPVLPLNLHCLCHKHGVFLSDAPVLVFLSDSMQI